MTIVSLNINYPLETIIYLCSRCLIKLLKAPKCQACFHSNREFQYTSNVFKRKIEAVEMIQSRFRVGKYIDNMPMEEFFGILKSEMYYGKKFKLLADLKEKINEYIMFYNKSDFKKIGLLDSIGISKSSNYMFINL